MAKNNLERRLANLFAAEAADDTAPYLDPRLEHRIQELFSDVVIPKPTPNPTVVRLESAEALTGPRAVEPVKEIDSGQTASDQALTIVSPKKAGLDLTTVQTVGPVLEPSFETIQPARRRSKLGPVDFALIGMAVILVALIAFVWFQFSSGDDNSAEVDQPGLAAAPTITPSATATATPTAGSDAGAVLFDRPAPTATPTPVPGGRTVIIRPAAQDAGWVQSDDESVDLVYGPFNHFGEPLLYAGLLEGQIYNAAFQFDLSSIPRGAKIFGAGLRLTGLRDDLLAEAGQGSWQLQLLVPELDYHWQTHNYEQLHEAATWPSFAPLSQDQLGKNQVNEFTFTPEQLSLLEGRILESSKKVGPKVSFRIVGPMEGNDNLFAWAGSSELDGPGAGLELFLNIGPPPEVTPPPFYVIITSTPTAENIALAAAISLQLTAEAVLNGTATPLPPHWATPVVVTSVPTPANQETAEAMAREATAIALTTGEPRNIATASPTPTFVIITSTPTPDTVTTAVAEALRLGPAAPLPPNWVTPFVVTATPIPANQATAEVLQAIILTTGTPTPLPGNVQTATHTPVAIGVQPQTSPTATATPSPTPQPIPASLLGKIIFLSDREGATEAERLRADRRKATPQIVPQPYVLDPQTGELSRLTDIWPYDVAAARDSWSSDVNFEAYAQQLLWTNVDTGAGGRVATEVFAIHVYDHIYDVEQAITRLGSGIAYDPAWSPVSDEIAFVATESGNDEIWIINRDGQGVRQLTRNDWEWDKHPSWSPDGRQIIFYSNRTGNQQIWIMNKDGSEQRLLMDSNPYNDWDPVWIKYQEPAPPLLRQQDWRFQKPPGEVQR